MIFGFRKNNNILPFFDFSPATVYNESWLKVKGLMKGRHDDK
jgi:hypothetical protein